LEFVAVQKNIPKHQKIHSQIAFGQLVGVNKDHMGGVSSKLNPVNSPRTSDEKVIQLNCLLHQL